MSSSLKDTLQNEMKQAMRDGAKERLGVLRFLLAAIKQKEVDNKQSLQGESLPDDDILSVIEKQCKQRRDSIEQYQQAGRDDLANAESAELEVLQSFLPPPLEAAELTALISGAINATGAASMKDMGKVMNELRPKVQGRADMKQLSAQIKAALNG